MLKRTPIVTLLFGQHTKVQPSTHQRCIELGRLQVVALSIVKVAHLVVGQRHIVRHFNPFWRLHQQDLQVDQCFLRMARFTGGQQCCSF